MNKVTIVEEFLDGFRGDACLVRDHHGNYFVVSTVSRAEFEHSYGAIETLAFRSNAEGVVDNWMDVAGGGDMTRDEVIVLIAEGDLNDWDSEDDSFFQHEDVDYLFGKGVDAWSDSWSDWVLEND